MVREKGWTGTGVGEEEGKELEWGGGSRGRGWSGEGVRVNLSLPFIWVSS